MGAQLMPLDDFLARTGWADARRESLAGDASSRRYVRLTHGGGSAILMIVRPGADDSTCRFLTVTAWLRDRAYSAPAVLASEEARGFVLLEDLGDAVFARRIAQDPPCELPLYTAASDLLADLSRHHVPVFVRPLDAAALLALLDVIADWYLPAMGVPSGAASDIPERIAALYADFGGAESVIALRDFHAENLIWLPDRPGHARVGLLDYQDAVAAHPAYDLVSLLQDARRDVSPSTEAAVLQHYLTCAGQSEHSFGRLYALLGAHRALRILGVFARLAMSHDKPAYLPMMPRVFGYLARNLAHPDLGALSDTIRGIVPEPTPERLERLRQQCAQALTP
jgi:N-acetylmuramate 1-kinase